MEVVGKSFGSRWEVVWKSLGSRLEDVGKSLRSRLEVVGKSLGSRLADDHAVTPLSQLIPPHRGPGLCRHTVRILLSFRIPFYLLYAIVLFMLVVLYLFKLLYYFG